MNCDCEIRSFCFCRWWCERNRWHVLGCSFENIGVVPQCLCELLSSACNWLPIGWACVVAKRKSGMHDQGIMRHCTMHCHLIRIVLDSRECALDVIVTCVTIIGWVRDCQVPVPNTELMERICEMKRWFVYFAGPVINCVRS
jgi:hypothetical protein